MIDPMLLADTFDPHVMVETIFMIGLIFGAGFCSAAAVVIAVYKVLACLVKG